MTAVLAGSCVGERIGTRLGQPDRIIQLAIGGDRRAAKLKQQTTVEIEPQRTPIRFTRRVRHHRPFDPPQEADSYTEMVLSALKIAASSDECGLN